MSQTSQKDAKTTRMPAAQKTAKAPKSPAAQKSPAPARSQAAQNKKPAAPAKKPAPKKSSSTKAFDTVSKKKKGFKSPRARKRIIIAILAIITLLFAALLSLILYNMFSNNTPEDPNTNVIPNMAVDYIPKDAGDVNIGNLLIINSTFSYTFPSDMSDMINLYQYQRNSENTSKTQINGSYTYSLTYDRICLNKTTLDALNSMMMDYCNSLEDLSGASANSASNIEIAWGGYSSSNTDEYTEDINIGKGFYDHALGTTFTIKQSNPSTVLTEKLLKNKFEWIYTHAHEYGFIIRFPNACESHTGENSNTRVHLRYVGVEHATYIYENGICLDEYLELIKSSHTINNPLTFTVGDKEYQVYYFKYSGNPTSIPVPKDSVYTISGDNMNGFIVTVEK